MSSTISSLSPHLQASFAKLTEEQQSYFTQEYNKKKKELVVILLLAIFFPIQLFFLNKTGLAIAFWLTAGGCGLWYLIEIFMASSRTKEYNEELAGKIMQEVKTLHS
jgi:uncharacterized membrane protein